MSAAPASPVASIRKRLKALYEGQSAEAHRFRYGLLVFDIVTLIFIVATSFSARENWIEVLDVIFGLLILADFCARLFISDRPFRELLHPVTWADAASIVSFLAPLVGEPAGFLRVLRTLRLLRSYQLLARLRAECVERDRGICCTAGRAGRPSRTWASHRADATPAGGCATARRGHVRGAA
jgi:voltage-gated potassium channel